MSLSAASFGLVLTLAVQSQAPFSSAAVLRDLGPSIVTILSDGRPVGPAALIDSSGLYVASRQVLGARALEGRLSDGRIVLMQLVSEDRMAQLVLLQAPADAVLGSVFGGPNFSDPAGPLVALTVDGLVRADMISTRRLGIQGTQRRIVPLCEIRFAGAPEQLTTALFFQGRTLVGPLVSSLPATTSREIPTLPPATDASGRTAFGFARQYGPASLAVGYVPGPEVMQRVIDGFTSPSHHVSHPYLGCICRDAIGLGAEVVSVLAKSGAARAGIRSGDIILGVGSVSIRDQVDYAQAMFRQRVGSKVTLLIKRGSSTILAEAIVGDGTPSPK